MMHSPRFRKFRFLMPFAIAGFLALFTYVVYALWNGVVTDVFAVKTITYWQALGLLVLAKILFGGFPGRRCGCGGWKARMASKHWETLSPEEREKFRAEMKRRFGAWPRPGMCDEDGADDSCDAKERNEKS